VHITAKLDYAVRAVVELASANGGGLIKSEAIAEAQDIPQKYLGSILGDLRHAGIVDSQRGTHGGFQLARPASEITIADVIRALDGPLATVRGEPPEDVDYAGSAAPLRDVWFALRANLRAVTEHVSIAELARDEVPARIAQLAADPDARLKRSP
jgi:Rrf2 family protein